MMLTRRTLMAAAAVSAGAVLLPHAADAVAPKPAPLLPPELAERTRRLSAGKHILLLSGWATHNIGDVGHTPGTLRYFEEFMPDATVTCWISKTNETVNAMLKRRFPRVELVQGTLDNSGTSKQTALQQAFDRSDLVVQNSGMLYNRFWNAPVGILYACRSKNKSYGQYGESFDGLPVGKEAETAKLLSGSSFIFTRDDASLVFLRSQPVTPQVLEFGPDGCFGVDVRDEPKAEAYLATNGLEPKKFVCVILRSDAAEMLGSKTTDPEKLQQQKDRLNGWCEKLVAVITHVVVDLKMKVALVPEVEKEMAAAKKLIYDRLPDELRASVVCRSEWWCTDEAVSVYARAFALVAMEPHSCIMATAVGVPAVHYYSLVHGTKAYMFRDVGLSEWLIDIDQESAATVNRALDRIAADPALATEKARRARDFVDRRSAEMASTLTSIVFGG